MWKLYLCFSSVVVSTLLLSPYLITLILLVSYRGWKLRKFSWVNWSNSTATDNATASPFGFLHYQNLDLLFAWLVCHTPCWWLEKLYELIEIIDSYMYCLRFLIHLYWSWDLLIAWPVCIPSVGIFSFWVNMNLKLLVVKEIFWEEHHLIFTCMLTSCSGIPY